VPRYAEQESFEDSEALRFALAVTLPSPSRAPEPAGKPRPVDGIFEASPDVDFVPRKELLLFRFRHFTKCVHSIMSLAALSSQRSNRPESARAFQ
jgi:hypothetical protein